MDVDLQIALRCWARCWGSNGGRHVGARLFSRPRGETRGMHGTGGVCEREPPGGAQEGHRGICVQCVADPCYPVISLESETIPACAQDGRDPVPSACHAHGRSNDNYDLVCGFGPRRARSQPRSRASAGEGPLPRRKLPSRGGVRDRGRAAPRRRLLAPHRKRRLGSLLATESQPASGPGSCVRAASPPPGPAVVTSHPAASRCVLWAALPVAPRSGAQRSRSRGKPAGCSPDSAPTPAPPRVRAAGAPWPRASLAGLRPEAQDLRPRGASPHAAGRSIISPTLEMEKRRLAPDSGSDSLSSWLQSLFHPPNTAQGGLCK
ncbi:uncharacterized protein [Vulpes vulpes]|uniref:Uncharacterized protein n=1 Tax=Vulpes vulpes TaxID=9627 RepID=A0ABM4XE76_VULVU